jgi:hypothetical protein
MDGSELRRRLKGLGYSHRVAAAKLGLSMDGLTKQLYGVRPVSRQTAIIVELCERLEQPDIIKRRQQDAATIGLKAHLGLIHLGVQPSGHQETKPEEIGIQPSGQHGRLAEAPEQCPAGVAVPTTGSPRVLATRRSPASLAARRQRLRGL